MQLRWSIFTLLLVLAYSCSKEQQKESVITIATAANMQFAMEALREQFTTETGIECRLVVSSSGKLTAQIQEGAPFDVFVAANMKYPQEIYLNGYAEKPPIIYAYGQLVLWSMRNDLEPDLSILKDASIKQIAMANPKTAPYGQAALEVLKKLELDTAIQQKLVYGESIAQANQFILTQAADIGFTSMSVVLSDRMQGNGRWKAVDEKLYQPIEQGLVLIKTSETKAEQARQFYNFLFSSSARKILTDYGYKTKLE